MHEYSYDKYGIGLINGPSTFNNVSNYFMQDLRLECGSYGFRAPKEVWENGDAYAIWKCLGPIWRGINNVQKKTITEFDGSTCSLGVHIEFVLKFFSELKLSLMSSSDISFRGNTGRSVAI